MRIHFTISLIVLLTVCVLSCTDENKVYVDPVTASLVESLNEELDPLSPVPVQWSDSELRFLDGMSEQAIVGLGEATHGTSEFFEAKYRMWRYMVERHGFKIFAIEADFGESIFINQAVLSSDKTQLETLMKEKMGFWTWRTNEVLQLLNWMCDYNLGKPEEEKVQYWGVDCQVNRFHPDMARQHIQSAGVPFIAFAETILDEASKESEDRFASYSKNEFDNYIGKIDALQDSVAKYKAAFLETGSEKKFQLTVQLVEVIRQVSEVAYYISSQSSTKNYRDEYMAKNTAWLHDYFNGSKIVLWAHNFHVSDNEAVGSMGYHLKKNFPGDYSTIGFLFSKGSFNALTQYGGEWGLGIQTIEKDPKLGSINDVMFKASEDVFTVALKDLQKHDEWAQAFEGGIEYFQLGSAYTAGSNYYLFLDPIFFDRLIYFENTTSSSFLR